ncbi:hypothetical protein [Streptomyces sp. NPDC002265]|uniref:hypothetical protein n=1 Tax=Streptomyces sp. NPDC002265 TaxID=3154415 RepID=UPI003332990D
MNHSPDEKSPAGLDSGELALRSLLHEAVRDMEPRDGTLDHLRRAVPARRARKRQAAVGMAAAALFVGTAIPALLHVSYSGASDADPSIAADSSQAQGGATSGKNPDGGAGISGGSGGKTGTGQDGPKDTGQSKDPGNATGASADPTASSTQTDPVCTAGQLGSSSATAEVPDSAGVVYGTFRVANVSTTGCTVGGPGSVSLLAQGAADATRITVVEHAAGDAAAGLPDPSLYVPQLTIAPGSAYEVKFAWVPSATCPTTGAGNGSDSGGGTPAPSPSPSGGSAASGSTTGGDTGTSAQTIRADGTADGSVVASYTPEAGSPTASVAVSNACTGTIYRTGVLAAS